MLQVLLKENNPNLKATGIVEVDGKGAEAAPDLGNVQSPETYVGYARQEHYNSPEPIKPDSPFIYTAPGRLTVNQWGLQGAWNVGGEQAVLVSAPGKIIFRFHSRDLHLVLGPGKDGKPIRFRVLLDGSAPMSDAGVDVDGQGNGTVKEYRLYQLIRQMGQVECFTHVSDANFYLNISGVQAFAFTFG